MEMVARAARVHRTTVSMALRNHPSLPVMTKNRIRAVAERLGYRPNPLVQALMASRVGRVREPFHAELAFVSNDRIRIDWENGRNSYAKIFRSARAHAERRGYRLTPWWRTDREMSGERFNHILGSRNIHGVLIAPHFDAANTIDLHWDRYSCMEIGYNLNWPNIHRVVHDHFHGMKLALAQLGAKGIKRPGLVLLSDRDDKVHHLWRAAFIDAQSGRSPSEQVPPLIVEKFVVAEFQRWFREHRPEVILGILPQALEPVLRACHLQIPRDVGFVNLVCHRTDDKLTGIYHNFELMGEVVIDQLIDMLHRGERGVPKQSQTTLIGGVWIEGETVKFA